MARISWWARGYSGCGNRRFFERGAQGKKNPARPLNARRVADDFRHDPTSVARFCSRWKSVAVPLDWSRNCLSALSRGDWLLLYLSASLLAPAADVGDQLANDFAHYSARCDRPGLGLR